jgi:SAM-dependent methyltransferase
MLPQVLEALTDERDNRCQILKGRLRAFYSKTQDYTAFHDVNDSPVFWQPVREEIEACLQTKQRCRVLEVGAGRTGFARFVADIRSRIEFVVQDITPSNEEYLRATADEVHIGDVREIIGNFDVIFSTFVWEHIVEPRQTLTYILSLLPVSGCFIIVSPRYDFPLYVSPSSRHLSVFNRLIVSAWLFMQRCKVLFGGDARFLIHTDPAVFHIPWFRDADAIHWVSYWDLERFLPQSMHITRIRRQVSGLKARMWEAWLLMFVKIRRISE